MSKNKFASTSSGSQFNKTRLAAAISVIVASAFGVQMAQAGAGWADNTDKDGRDFKQRTYYANSPSGLQASNGPVNADVMSSKTGNLATQTSLQNSALPRDTGLPIRKFVDSLPLFKPAGSALHAFDPGSYLSTHNTNGVTAGNNRHIPIAVADTASYPGSDYYEIAVVEFRQQLHSDLPGRGTTIRGYVQIWHSALDVSLKGPQLFYLDGTPILDNKGQTVFAVEKPQYLGPLINSQSGKPVRLKFNNYLPTGHFHSMGIDTQTGKTIYSRGGDSFIPTDITVPGSGIGPLGAADPMNPKPSEMYTGNRAMIHLHGGDTPWISDGEPHSWIIPAGDEDKNSTATPYKRGETTQNVPDMPDPGLGAQTYYFPNNQSARMEWYHDHSYGATRINVSAGEVAGYLIQDPIEAEMTANGVLPADVIPLIYQDLSFVPKDIDVEDAKWNTDAWGEYGDFWFPHVYEVNQNPNSLDGTNPSGRWDYGPWFWPVFPAPLALPTGEFDPKTGISHASGVQENYHDTSTVNGVPYPNLNIEPKPYRFRLLNGSTARFLNLGLYVAEPLSIGVSNGGSGYSADTTVSFMKADGVTPDTLTQGHLAIDSQSGAIAAVVIDKLDPAGYTAAPTVAVNDPGATPGTGAAFVVSINTEVPMVDAVKPRANAAYAVNTYDGRPGGIPDPAAIGPDIVHIGTEGGWLAKASVIPSTPISYQQLRRIVTVLNVLDHGLYVGPAERADFVVDFSAYAGKTLILYNDAPAPNPGFDARVDYYTGDVDQSATGGAPTTMPGQGPNTRTVMRIQVDQTVATPTNFAGIENLKSALPGYFKRAELQPTVPQSWQNDAYGTSYGDNLARIYAGSAQQPTFTFNLPVDPNAAKADAPTYTVTSVTLDSQGMGYSATPTVLFEGGADPALLDANGALIDDTATGGTHRPAKAIAIMDAAGARVAAIQMSDPGKGYTSTPHINIVASDGNGLGAAATALTTTTSTASLTSGLGCAEGTGAVTCTVQVQPKGIQELFDPSYGRMNATFSAELPFTAVLNQTTIPVGYIDPPTEAIGDGETQFWKITHNGVDTHPVHFHLFNVQVINRVAWDGTVVEPDPAEFGWKETVKMNPLEDIYVAVKPKAPLQPFGVPQSIRPLDPTQPLGTANGFSQVDPTTGLATTVVNDLHNFDWEYVWHCHILGHEENDFMRVISFNFGAVKPGTPLTTFTPGSGSVAVNWTDPTPVADPNTPKSKGNEIGFIVQRADNGAKFADLPATIPQSAAQNSAVANANSAAMFPASLGVVVPANTTTWTDDGTVFGTPPTLQSRYRVVAFNAAGYSDGNVNAVGSTVGVTAGTVTSATGNAGAAGTTNTGMVATVTGLTSSLGTWDPNVDPNTVAGRAYAQPNTTMALGGFPITLGWSSNNPTGTTFTVVRSGGTSATAAGLQDVTISGVTGTTFTDPEAPQASTLTYKVTAVSKVAGKSVTSPAVQVQVTTPFAPPPAVTGLNLSTNPLGGVTIDWAQPQSTAYVTAYRVIRRDNGGNEVWFVVKQDVNALSGVITPPATTYTDNSIQITDTPNVYTYTVSAINGTSVGAESTPAVTYSTIPVAPTLNSALGGADATGQWQATLNWSNAGKASHVNAYQVYRLAPGADPVNGWVMVGQVAAAAGAGATETYVDTIGLQPLWNQSTVTYQYYVKSAWVAGTAVTTSAAPSNQASALFQLPEIPGLLPSVTFGGSSTKPTVALSWTEATVPGAPLNTGYNVYRDGVLLATTTNTRFTDSSNVANQKLSALPAAAAATAASIPTYAYTVAAVNSLGASAPSGADTVALVQPGIPATLALTYNGNARNAATQANLTWTAAALPSLLAANVLVPPTTNYSVTETGVAGRQTVTALTANLVPTNLATATVIANSALGASPAASIQLNVVVPPAPALSAATTTYSNRVPLLSWSASTDTTTGPVLGYSVFVNTTNPLTGTWNFAGTVAGLTSAGLNLAQVTAGNTYNYRVTAYNNAGPSLASNDISVVGIPNAPGNVTRSVANGVYSLNWGAATGADNYVVTIVATKDAGVVDSNPATTTTVLPATTLRTVALPAIDPGYTYTYSVVAVNAGGTSASTALAGVVHGPVPLAPANFARAVDATTGAVTLSWNASTGAASYLVTRVVSAPGTTTSTTTYPVAGGSTTTYTMPTNETATGSTYSYTVQAVDASGNSLASAAQTYLTVPAAPTNLTQPNGTTLQWTASTGATSYTVTGSVYNWTDGTTTALAAIAPVTTQTGGNWRATVPAIAAGTTVTYSVVANNATGSSLQAGTRTVLGAVPAAPGALAMGAGYSLSWNATTGAGVSFIVTATATGGGTTKTYPAATGTSLTLDAPTAGATYSYTVKASYTNGQSTAASTALSSSTLAPTTPTVTPTAGTGANVGTISVAYTGSTPNAAYPITVSIKLNAVSGGATAKGPFTATASPYVFTGLTRLQRYTATVTTTNAWGVKTVTSGNVTVN